MPDENGHIPGITRSLLKYNFVFTSKKNKRYMQLKMVEYNFNMVVHGIYTKDVSYQECPFSFRIFS